MIEGTEKSALQSRVLETIPTMEYVWERMNWVRVNEKMLRRRERVVGRHEGEEASGALGTPRLRGRMAYVIDRRRHAAPGCGNRSVPVR